MEGGRMVGQKAEVEWGFIIIGYERFEGKRGKKGFNGEEKYTKVQKRVVLDMFILRTEETTYQIIGSQESILRSSVDFFLF